MHLSIVWSLECLKILPRPQQCQREQPKWLDGRAMTRFPSMPSGKLSTSRKLTGLPLFDLHSVIPSIFPRAWLSCSCAAFFVLCFCRISALEIAGCHSMLLFTIMGLAHRQNCHVNATASGANLRVKAICWAGVDFLVLRPICPEATRVWYVQFFLRAVPSKQKRLEFRELSRGYWSCKNSPRKKINIMTIAFPRGLSNTTYLIALILTSSTPNSRKSTVGWLPFSRLAWVLSLLHGTFIHWAANERRIFIELEIFARGENGRNKRSTLALLHWFFHAFSLCDHACDWY